MARASLNLTSKWQQRDRLESRLLSPWAVITSHPSCGQHQQTITQCKIWCISQLYSFWQYRYHGHHQQSRSTIRYVHHRSICQKFKRYQLPSSGGTAPPQIKIVLKDHRHSILPSCKFPRETHLGKHWNNPQTKPHFQQHFSCIKTKSNQSISEIWHGNCLVGYLGRPERL